MDFDDLTDEQKKALADNASVATVKVAAGVASGRMDCLSCGEAVKVQLDETGMWTANCPCGWSAAGIGNFSKSLN